MISVEKDLLVGAKKLIQVPMSVPEVPDLELTWDVSVRRANIGLSAVFVPDNADATNDLGEPLGGPVKGPPPGRTPRAARTSPEGGERRGWFRRQPSKASETKSDVGDDDGDEDEAEAAAPTVALEALPGAVSIFNYERVSRGDDAQGVFRFHGQPGRVIFSLDNRYSKTRRKRVLVKLNVESVNAEAEAKQEEAEVALLHQLRDAVLKRQVDPEGYLDSDLNLKRFLDARPTFEAAVDMLANTVRWRTEGRYFVPGGCALCVAAPATHVWRQIGFDKERRPVIFFALSQVVPHIRNSYKPMETLIHIINLLENGHKTMEPGAACGFTWIMDLQGMTWADCRLLQRLTGDMEGGGSKDGKPITGSGKNQRETFISVLADHYPQTLGACVMLRPPVFLLSVFKAVKAFMDPKTAKAYYFVRSPPKIEEALDELFEPSVGAWIRKEINLVTADHTATAVAEGRPFRGPALWQVDEASGHDPRGTPEYTRRYCCPTAARAPGDRLHHPHPNICQLIDSGAVGLEAAPPEVARAAQAAAASLPPPPTGSSLDGEASELKLTPKQEREEARKIIRMTLGKIKKAVDESEAQGQTTRGKRNAGRRKKRGLSYGTLERLALEPLAGGDDDEGGAGDLETMLDEILQKELVLPEGRGDDEDDDEEDEDEDDDDDESLRAFGGAADAENARRVLVAARGYHVEEVRMTADGGKATASSVSWAFQIETGDIGFSATFRAEGGEASDGVPVVPWTRCASHTLHRGDFKAPAGTTNGVLTLRWDNTYSRVRSKAVTFDVRR